MLQVMLELKVCEGCGKLWLRPREDKLPYCASCRVRLTSFPRRARKKRAFSRPCGASRLTLVKRQEEVQA